MQQEAWRSNRRLVSIERTDRWRPGNIQETDGRQDRSHEGDIAVWRRRAGDLAGAPRSLMVVVTGHVLGEGNCSHQINMGVSGKAMSDEQGDTRNEKRKSRTTKLAPGLHRPHATCGH